MQILHMCPANIATGGTEGIHHLVSELCKCGADAKILYIGSDLTNPQPECYKKYECEYLTAMPSEYESLVILPEVWANRIVEPQFQKCQVAINWQGIDVYKWNNPKSTWNKFLQRDDALHITMSEYGMRYLRSLGLNPLKISDCINENFFDDFTDSAVRSDVVLYNPVRVKMTDFQQSVMARATTERGIRFAPLEGYTQSELMNVLRQHKLYIDFGVFSGRERLPREAVTQGCCILTSNMGTAKDYLDNSILEKYKFDTTNMLNANNAIDTILYILQNYESCKSDFVEYKRLLKKDLDNYHKEVKELYNEILNRNTCA